MDIQGFQWDACDRARARRHAPNTSHALDLSRPQNFQFHWWRAIALSLSSTTNFLWQLSMASLFARVDGQPASFDKFFIDKYICPCKLATSFFDNFLLSYWPAVFKVLTDLEFHKLSQLCRVSKSVDVAASLQSILLAAIRINTDWRKKRSPARAWKSGI